MHPGKSETFKKQMVRREERTAERYVHQLAKQIYAGLRNNTLDPRTHETFKWQRKRLALYEKAQLQTNPDQAAPTFTVQQQKESDKGRVRKIKVKVKRVLEMPYCVQKLKLGKEWLEKFMEFE